jgi:regulator of sirC expression with transglutaminase-like and TPR domain
MKETREIAALFHLIDDPDKEVFTTVSERIVSFGKPIIPNLEHLWETTPDEKVQERIELMIHSLHYRDLKTELTEWSEQPGHNLLAGSLLVSKYLYPEMHLASVLQEIEKIRRNIWLELNNYLTPLEKANVVTTILYNYYHLKGTEIDYSQPGTFLIDKAIEAKKGNAIANGILYMCLCEMLDIALKVINIPIQFILAYFNKDVEEQADINLIEYIQFYLDPMNGQAFTRMDVEGYLKRISASPEASYFIPMNNKSIIRYQLEELAKCFNDSKNKYKQDELLQLAAILI